MKTNIRILQGHQIGGCITIISTENSKIVIDFGSNLPGSKATDNIEFDWCKEKVDAVFFTHYHGDHIGRFMEIPADVSMYMGKTTYTVMSNIRKAIKDKDALQCLEKRKNIYFLKRNKAVSVGDITVIPYDVDHSAFDAYMFLVKAGDEYILHTGDYRDHGHRGHIKGKNGEDRNITLEIIKKYITDNGKRKINALITEGTMMSRGSEKHYSEKELLADAKAFFKDNRYIFLKISSTNVDSLASFAQAAKLNNMKMYVTTYVKNQMETYKKAGEAKGTKLYSFENVQPLFPAPEDCTSHKQREFSEQQRLCMRREGFVIYASEKAYFKKTIEEFKDLPVKTIYSMWEGYLKRGTGAYDEQLDQFCKKMNAIHMHTSGHAYPSLIEQVINAVNPTDAIIPIHTEAAEQFEQLNLKEGLKEKIRKELDDE